MAKQKFETENSNSSLRGCILCGRKAQVIGVFVPDRGSDYGVPDGWNFIYLLCDDHYDEGPDVRSRVERHIWKHRQSKIAKTRK